MQFKNVLVVFRAHVQLQMKLLSLFNELPVSLTLLLANPFIFVYVWFFFLIQILHDFYFVCDRYDLLSCLKHI